MGGNDGVWGVTLPLSSAELIIVMLISYHCHNILYRLHGFKLHNRCFRNPPTGITYLGFLSTFCSPVVDTLVHHGLEDLPLIQIICLDLY